MVRVRNLFNGLSKDVPTKEIDFRISVYGILVKDGKLLIHVHPKSPKYNLPGGKIEKGERLEEGLIREFREETGLIIRPVRLKTVKEDFINFSPVENKSYHSILIFYEVEKVGGKFGDIGNIEDSVEVKFVTINSSLRAKMQEVFKDIVDNKL